MLSPELSYALAPFFTDRVYLAAAVLLLVIFVSLRMRPRRFYFVRHGQTILNAQNIRQGADGGLSDVGKLQAKATGEWLRQFHIRRILASSFERGRETAQIIASSLKVPVVYSPLLAERRNPTEIIGKFANDPAVAKIVDQMDMAYHEDDYRFSDEENFQDLKTRARKALALLSRQGARETCVVTHGIFLKMLISYLLYRENLHAADYAKLSFFNASDNASVTICEYRPWQMFSKTRGWQVVEYNARVG